MALFAWSVVRLGGRGLQELDSGLTPLEWVALAVLMIAFVYGEGVLAIGRRWIPAYARRLDGLRALPGSARRILAPLYGASLIDATTPSLVRNWAGTTALVAVVFAVRALPDPWRAMVDLSVAAALAWGLVVLMRYAPRRRPVPGSSATAPAPPPPSPQEVPEAPERPPARTPGDPGAEPSRRQRDCQPQAPQ